MLFTKKRLPFIVGRGPVPRQCSRNLTIAGDRPPRYGRRKSPFHRRARACPSPAFRPSRTPTIAGDRPPRYGRRKSPFHRRARACPSPCLDLHGKRPGAARGFRAGRTIAGETRSDARMASEGPRATVGENPPFTVGRGPVPRRASSCTGNGLGLRAGFAQVQRARGKPARMRGGHPRAPALREKNASPAP